MNTKYKERKIILTLYAIFFGISAVGFMTPPSIAATCMMLSILIVGGIYSYRSQVEKDSLVHNHMTFIIRTFWRMNLYFLITTIIGLTFLLASTDYSSFSPCFVYVTDRFQYVMMNWGLDEYHRLFSQCMTPFIKNNTFNLVFGIFFMIFPILIYLLNRLILGWSHAKRGIPVQLAKL